MAHFGGHLRVQATLGKLLSLINIDTPQQIFHPRHRTTVHRQMAIAHPDQDRHAHRIARHFAAQAQVDTKTLGVAGNHRQRPQNARMQAVVHTGDPGIVAIHRQNVLGQVVGANGDKIDAIRQLRQHKHHRRHFQHHAETRTGNGVADHLFHFAAGAIDQATGLIHFIETGDHRQQDTEVSGRRVGAQHRADLHQKDLRLIERDPNSAPAKARILFADRHIRQLFIRADVQRAQRHRFLVEHLQHALILGNLLLFRREAALQHKGDFGTVKADTVDEIAELFFVLRAEARVEHHFYPLAAFQFRSAFKIVLSQATKLVLFADQALILLQQHRLRVDQ